jgi:hypothetical protein
MKVKPPDERWSKIVDFPHTYPDLYIGEEDDCCRFVEGVLWFTRSSAQWRLLPDEYGNSACISGSHAGVTKGYRVECTPILPKTLTWSLCRWTARSFAPIPVRLAHPKKGSQVAQALGRSRGGFSTKVFLSLVGALIWLR